MKVIRLFAVVAGLGATACSQKGLIEQRQRTAAPASVDDVGIILDGAQAGDVERLLGRFPDSRVRVLNTRHGMYELFGIERSEAQLHTKAQVEENIFFEMQRQREPSPLFKALSVPGPVGVKVGSLSVCRPGRSGPIAILQAVEPKANLKDTSIKFGQQIRVSGASSAAPRAAILIDAPNGSVFKERVVDDVEYRFTPDALGIYRIVLVVQDEQDVCAMDRLQFVVTDDRQFKGAAVPQLRLDLKKFNHLAQVSAEESWRISQGEGTLIAVIDTGVNYNHPALAPAIQLNAKEIPDNGIDDDGNGLVDDVLGYDFVNGDAYPFDDDNHGSHVAGLAAGRPFGMAPKARVLPIKALNGIGGDVASIAAAVVYATDRGAKVINMSLGAPSRRPPPIMERALDYAESKGALVIVSAGNGDPATGLGYSIEEIPTFPASFPHRNKITVGSFDKQNLLSTYSNFGGSQVHVLAPGGLAPSDPMISAGTENPQNALFVGMTGTSMATPVVSGIAAQILSLNPRLTPVQVRDILLHSGREFEELKQVCRSGRHINALDAVQIARASTFSF